MLCAATSTRVYGLVTAKGVPNVARLIERIEDPGHRSCRRAPSTESCVCWSRPCCADLDEIGRSTMLDAEIARRAIASIQLARRLMTIPGVGPGYRHERSWLFAPAPQTFRAGRHLRRLDRAHAQAVKSTGGCRSPEAGGHLPDG